MTKTLPIVLVLGLSLAACSTPEDQAPAPPAPAPPAAKPAPEKAAMPAPAPVAEPAADPMAAALALYAAGNYAEAAPAFDAITKAHPKNGEAWFRLGYSLHALGQLEQASVANTKAAEFPQWRASALYNLGCERALQGRADAAFEALNRALDSGFSELLILQDDADLESLRADARYAALVERLTKPKA